MKKALGSRPFFIAQHEKICPFYWIADSGIVGGDRCLWGTRMERLFTQYQSPGDLRDGGTLPNVWRDSPFDLRSLANEFQQ